MKSYFLTTAAIIVLSNVLAQNIDYTARITQFYGSNCGGEFGNEEHTWKGWLSDNFNTVETYSGCIQRNINGAVTQTGTYANRVRTNTPAIELRSRIDAWEDDTGSRCDFNSGTFSSDDCRANQTCVYPFWNPVEYQNTVATSTCGSGDYNMNVYRSYRYSETSIANAVDNTTPTYTTGGNRPFWGSRGSWAVVGSDCATSGTITHNQTSSFSFTVSCVSQVSFRWRVSSEANYDFLRVFVNGAQQAAISGNVGWATYTLNLPTGGASTIEFRYTKDGSQSANLDRGFVDYIQLNNANSIAAGSVSGATTICEGQPIPTLTSLTAAQSYSPTINYQWQMSLNNATWTNIAGANGPTYTPTAYTGTRYFRRRVQDGCGLTGYTNILPVVVNQLSTAPTIAAIASAYCPNTTLNLTASGGITGAGAQTNWYTGPNGTGTWVGSGNVIPVAPMATTTYYVRREGSCNNTADDAVTVNVRSFVYGNNGETATGSCLDNSGWHHFYNGDRILLSIQGDLSGVIAPNVTINTNGTFYQAPNLPTDCGNNVNPGEESFEMSRSWNFDPNGGTLNGTYNVRFYYPPAERAAIENAAAAWIAANPACSYMYTYPYPNGFYWFKNTGSNYTAPDYDGLQLAGSVASVGGTNYTELTGITSFSGGSGAVKLTPLTVLPIALSAFNAACLEDENAARIAWTSESEKDASHYVVERSYDGTDWKKLGEMEAAGNSNVSLQYEMIDPEIRLSETVFYRLSQFDLDGESEELGITSVSCTSKKEGFEIYPNPVASDLQVTVQGIESNQIIDLHILDMKGNLVRTISNATAKGNILSVDLTSLAPGMYIIQMIEGEIKIQTERFIKE